MPMKHIVPAVLVLSIAIAACSDPASAPAAASGGATLSSARGPAVHRVSAGGADQIAPGVDANWSLIAFQYADGTASGQWSDQFGHGNGGFHAVVECLNVVNNEAWVSGTARGGDFDGRRWMAHMRDNGTSAKDPEDEISFSWLTLPNSNVDCRAPFPMPLTPRSGGQVKID
jgi:hypothetical protein